MNDRLLLVFCSYCFKPEKMHYLSIMFYLSKEISWQCSKQGTDTRPHSHNGLIALNVMYHTELFRHVVTDTVKMNTASEQFTKSHPLFIQQTGKLCWTTHTKTQRRSKHQIESSNTNTEMLVCFKGPSLRLKRQKKTGLAVCNSQFICFSLHITTCLLFCRSR